MKIAFVVHDYRRQEGHSRYVVELASRFCETHEVHVFANRIDRGANSKIHFHFVPAWRPNALISIFSFAILANLYVRGRFDIIHNQGLCGFRGNVFTAHICNQAWRDALRRSACGLNFRGWLSATLLSAFERLFYGTVRNSHVIAVSERIDRDLRAQYHCHAPSSVIYHGVDLSAFHPANRRVMRQQLRAEIGIGDEETVFLFVGDPRKGAWQCIHALSQVRAGRLLIVSQSDAGVYDGLAGRLGVQERVKFIRGTRPVQEYYAAADVFLLPTPYDAFAMVVTEAMAAGLPVIVSREAGAAELIRHGENGLLLHDFNSDLELADAMSLLQRDRELATRIATEGRLTVEKYSWDLTAQKTMLIYQRVQGAGALTAPAESAKSVANCASCSSD